ncbi:MAG TPA: DNA polymerase III subunit delta' [Candidatus Paceibacterota bacterium]|nr:DNA polymerase III subunit delta' [Candidatus Paceibacterota bacterium]
MFFKYDGATTFLERFFDSDKRLVQNLLFWGEESVGKMTTAEEFSKTLLCSGRNGWKRCEKCDSCEMIKKGYHPDLMIIEPEGDSVKIEQIRNGLKFLFYHPQIASLKILIIAQADKMTEDCQNALLKTLEEPRENNLIILVTSAPKRLLTTIRSRVLPLRFKRITNKEIIDFLQKQYSLSQNEAEEIAERADGKIGKVIKLLDKDYKKELDQKRKDLKEILNQGFAKQSVYFQKLVEDSGELKSTLEEWLRVLKSDTDSKELKLISEKRIKLIDSILKSIYLIADTNINRQLLMENIFLQL